LKNFLLAIPLKRNAPPLPIPHAALRAATARGQGVSSPFNLLHALPARRTEVEEG